MTAFGKHISFQKKNKLKRISLKTPLGHQINIGNNWVVLGRFAVPHLKTLGLEGWAEQNMVNSVEVNAPI